VDKRRRLAPKRDLRTFRKWFDLQFHAIVEDLVDDILVDDILVDE
jgi:hypothetical protein